MDRRSFLRRTLGGAAAVSMAPAFGSMASGRAASRTQRIIGGQVYPRVPIPVDGPDVVMICIDDLNDWVGFLGHPLAQTPNLDALAAQSMIFDNAYCSVPLCMPSRASALTSTSPANSGILGRNDLYAADSRAAFDEDEGQGGYRADGAACLDEGICYEDFLDSKVSVFDHFWLNGYRTAASGKVYHGWRSTDFDTFDARIQAYRKAYVTAITEDATFTQVGSFKWSRVPTESDHYDYLIANWMRRQLSPELLNRRHRPWFLVAGLFQPHVPWRIPQRFWDMYDPDAIQPVADAV
ncbi:MAG: sulfatase-like hydrolase/transferase, partial [Acidimicrobiales bacterium]|nr:sulfatase-like hydrolase/transferase [Acidimicrobiales bacterium]